MPTYEFRCTNGHTFDQLHKISDAPSTATCPVCGAEAVRAISGGAGLVFKGSGFYLTDYGRNAHRTSGPAPAAGGESTSGEGKGEAKGKGESGGGSTKDSSSGPGSGGGSGSSTGGTSGSAKSEGGTGGSTGGSTGGGSTGGSSGAAA